MHRRRKTHHVAQAIALFECLPWLSRHHGQPRVVGWRSPCELFAFRWKDFDEANRSLHVDEAVYEGTFDTPKTDASVRPIPLSDTALQLLGERRSQVRRTAPDDLIFSTVSGKPVSLNNVLRMWVWPACETAGLARATRLTFRRT